MKHFQDTELEFKLDSASEKLLTEYPSIRSIVIRVYGETDVEDAVSAARRRFILSSKEWKLERYERATI